TVRALENKLTALEGGADTTCFGTGMAAINALFLTFLNTGDHAIISDVIYGGTYRLATTIFNRFGVEFSCVDTSDASAVSAAVKDNTKLILTETPANPTLKLTDIAAVSEVAKEKGIPHAVDNTFLTPYYQRPLELGADLCVHSTTKYFDGHNATVGGAIVAGTQEHDDALRYVLNATGTIMSPQVAWLTLQGVKTLSVRMDRQSENAQAIAEYLEAHPRVERVCYPGLESFPQHELAKSQASGFGAMIWFEVEGGVKFGKALMDSIELWSLAENLGSLESLITHPVTMTHADVEEAERKRIGITDGLVRLSVGLEDVEDLVAALDKALAIV
ncbi:MAG: PLP-dependent aspartate aminotransferase family protein, partial [Gammaproteobacteria bacterium]|nr:PLP-dependent aspartate aminotransferase family protein [Gammaproteobacteria bacterium]